MPLRQLVLERRTPSRIAHRREFPGVLTLLCYGLLVFTSALFETSNQRYKTEYSMRKSLYPGGYAEHTLTIRRDTIPNLDFHFWHGWPRRVSRVATLSPSNS